MKRRARLEARVSKLKRKQASTTTGGEGEGAVVPPAASHVRKLQKRVRFLDRVKTSALAAKAAVFKRKRKTQGISLGALVCSAFAPPCRRTARHAWTHASVRLSGGCASAVAKLLADSEQGEVRASVPATSFRRRSQGNAYQALRCRNGVCERAFSARA